MADDTIAYLDRVIGGPAHLVGWSDGAVVGLLVALRRPDLVDRLVLIGQYYNSSGKVPGGLADQLGAGGDQVMGFLRGDYDRVSPVEAPRSSTPCWCGFSTAMVSGRS
jgi:pimeloyl-ACP methyl ester carboxylesterase